ncbi:MAG: ZIP family metal transporter [Nitrospiraceae bacterium]
MESFFNLIGLGALAGVLPVYLGIAVALFTKRMMARTWEGFLIGVANGVLVYLFFDLMHESVELTGSRDLLSWSVFLGCLFVSFVGLVALEQHQMRDNRSSSEPRHRLSLPYMIALGMGLHNLGEGLAIGASYANGEAVLSGLLVAGFALHNGTEGFGIVGAAGRTEVPWRDIVLLGVVAGAPTCLGTLLSGQELSPYFTLACFTLAAGSLLYVIFALTVVSYTATRRLQAALGTFLGISLMFITAMLLTLLTGITS